MTISSKRGAFLAAGLTVILWASAFAGIRAGLESYSPASVALLRYLVASVVLAGYAIVTKMPLPERSDLPQITLIGFLGFTAYNIALNAGEVAVSAGTASFIVASAPIFMALFATVFLKDHLEIYGWLGIIISFSGVALISFGTGDSLQLNPMVMLILMAAILQAMYSIMQKPLLKKYSPIMLVTYAVWIGTAFLLVFLPGLVREIPAASASATWAVIYMGVMPGAVGYVAWSIVLSRISASIAGSFLYLVPAFAILIAWLWLGEIPDITAVSGGFMIVLGVFIVNRFGR